MPAELREAAGEFCCICITFTLLSTFPFVGEGSSAVSPPFPLPGFSMFPPSLPQEGTAFQTAQEAFLREMPPDLSGRLGSSVLCPSPPADCAVLAGEGKLQEHCFIFLHLAGKIGSGLSDFGVIDLPLWHLLAEER